MAASGAEGAKKSALLREIADSTIPRHSKHLIEKVSGYGQTVAQSQVQGRSGESGI